MEPTDERLCRQIADREPGAFDTLVERYQERAYRIAWSVLHDREAAKDCSQEAFLKLYEAAGSFSGQSKFSTWFYRIVVNACLDHRRRGRGWRRVLAWREPEAPYEAPQDPLERVPAPFTDPGDVVDEDRRMTEVWEAVDELSPQQRTAVLLSSREGLSTREIAEILEVSEATVRVHVHRAMQTLRKRVGRKS